MATASINLPGAIWGSCKASAVAPGGYTSHRNCSDGWTVTPFVTTARFLDRHRWRTRKLVRELLVSIRVHFSPLPHSLSPFSCCKPHYLPSLPASCHRGRRQEVLSNVHSSTPNSLAGLDSIKSYSMMDVCYKSRLNCKMQEDIVK